MSDLNDFFAKKDRKHKKKNAPKAAPKPAVEKEASAPAPPAAPVQSKADDGWIELDDPKSAKVNTGGRTVVEFKRDAEDKDSAVEGSAQGEKFGGWSRSEGGEGEGDDEEGANGAAPIGGAAFPTLADAADAPEVPVSRGKSTTSSARPRFTNSNPNRFAGLRKMLQERDNASPPTQSK